MANRKQYKKRKIIFSARSILIIFALLVFGISVLLTKIFKYSIVTVEYDSINEVLYNPLMGYAPDAEYEEEVGNSKLVYMGITWAELEPQKGKYNFEEIEDRYNFEKWKEQGKKVVFRFMCDIPDDNEHMDIPEWLYELTKDGDFYDGEYGKGYSPNYANEDFIRYHANIINTMADHWGKDNFIAYIELGSIGHWGEWHVNTDEGLQNIPQSNVTDMYVEPYVKEFQNAKLIMRRPFSVAKKYELGLYNDMTGSDTDTNEWLDWINFGGEYDQPKKTEKLCDMPNVWEISPVGGEFTSSISFNEMLGKNISDTIEMIRKTHMTFIGPKCPLEEGQKNLKVSSDEVLKNVGYRYGIDKAIFKYRKLFNEAYCVLDIENSGVAPIYFDWKMFAYYLDDNNKIIDKQQLDVDLRTITGGHTKSISFKINEKFLKNGTPKIGIGIENPDTDEPEVYLNMDTKNDGFVYILN